MRKIDFELTFKEDLSNIEIAGVETIVRNFVDNNPLLLQGAVPEFAFTSSSSYAMQNVMTPLHLNDEETGKRLAVSHVGITTGNMLILVCEDEYEDYFYFEIEPKEF